MTLPSRSHNPKRFALALLLTGLLAACASTPPAPPPCPACLACPACPPPAPAAPFVLAPEPEPPAALAGARGRLVRSDWGSLPGLAADNAAEALAAFSQGCPVLQARPEWQAACRGALALAGPAPADALAFFTAHFDPYRVLNTDDTDAGLVTGYYEPLLRGSRTRTDEFRYPVYGVPNDLVSIDLSSIYPDLKFRRLRGRFAGDKVVPYLDRAAISSPAAPLRGLEIAWVDNAVELFFLEIQGSGQIQLPDGSRLRVGYAEQNGHPFRSLGGLLIRRGEIRAEKASMQGIKEWARRHPHKVQAYLNANPSFVFFKELPGDLTGPIGTLGVPLTAERSIAVDPRVVPLGVPVFLSTTFPNSPVPLNRLMVAQDTGGAIHGGVRADFYWGFGDEAGAQAGRMKQAGRMWVLLPKGYDPTKAEPAAPSAP